MEKVKWRFWRWCLWIAPSLLLRIKLKKVNTFFLSRLRSRLIKELKKCLELEKKTRSASIDTKRSSSTEMALRFFGAFLVLSLALEFYGLCEGQYQCLFTSCRKREVRQLGPTKYQESLRWKPRGKTFTVKSSYSWLIISDVLKSYFKQATNGEISRQQYSALWEYTNCLFLT